jgi:KDO2-lipid IV(A) lauroyltransferase
MDRQWIIDWLVYVAVRVLICLAQAMRIETCQRLAQLLAWVAADVLRVRGQVVDENLRHAFPTFSELARKQLARRMWEHLLLMVCEVAQTPRKIHRTNWHRFLQISQKRTFVRYLLDARPTLLVSGHFGNFELGGYVTGLLGFPTFTVARPLDNRLLDRFVNRFRSRNGQFIVPKENSARQIDALLARGAVLSLLGDQHAGNKGCWVEFFGRPASCHKAIALFTLISQAPLLVAFARRGSRPLRFEVGLAGVADPRNPGPEQAGVVPLTQWFNRRLESMISVAPDQYWWLHRRWKAPPARGVRAKTRPAA